MRDILIIAFGFGLLILQGALATLLPMHSFAPNLLLPIALLLGVSPHVHIVRGAMMCFMLGYLLDSFCGNPMGLQTFVLVASFLVARGAGMRLFARGLTFQMLLTFGMAMATGAVTLALRAIFERPAFELDLAQATTLLRAAVATALCGPFIVAAAQRIEGLSVGAERTA